jgi:hypothetical protein
MDRSELRAKGDTAADRAKIHAEWTTGLLHVAWQYCSR